MVVYVESTSAKMFGKHRISDINSTFSGHKNVSFLLCKVNCPIWGILSNNSLNIMGQIWQFSNSMVSGPLKN